MLGSDDFSITELLFCIGINFTFSSVLWKRAKGVVASKAWMAGEDSRIHKSYHNVLSCPIKATPSRPYSSWEPQELRSVCGQSPDLPIPVNRLHARSLSKSFCLLMQERKWAVKWLFQPSITSFINYNYSSFSQIVTKLRWIRNIIITYIKF